MLNIYPSQTTPPFSLPPYFLILKRYLLLMQILCFERKNAPGWSGRSSIESNRPINIAILLIKLILVSKWARFSCRRLRVCLLVLQQPDCLPRIRYSREVPNLERWGSCGYIWLGERGGQETHRRTRSTSGTRTTSGISHNRQECTHWNIEKNIFLPTEK